MEKVCKLFLFNKIIYCACVNCEISKNETQSFDVFPVDIIVSKLEFHSSNNFNVFLFGMRDDNKITNKFIF